MKKALTHLYIGNGKGKTSAAVGAAVRAKGAGGKVCFIQFLKGGFPSSELKILKRIGVKVLRFDQKSPAICKGLSRPQLKKKITASLKRVKGIISGGDYDIVVLDELLYALGEGLMPENEIIDLIDSKYHTTELILTGNFTTNRISKKADYISSVNKKKHPFDKKVKARLGIEY